ncbi:hypothetical protein LL912_12390 [Niabella sp. CC-SYL272]|uniref:hypothetical protein n=1 Tax=Niabella agricola TaxID=2891571 RepID=UPI001F300514|nr:hypothetical protein [Niabella agricola]MCF3109571.1 hypothetical protein [Niabella agricola]
MTEEEKKEIGVSIAKSIFAAIPYAGAVLTEITFDYRSRIKQNRLNRFTELLAEFFRDNRDIDLELLKTEDFCDLFESVLKRVTQTKSESKYKKFRAILTSQIVQPKNNGGDAEIYLDLVTALSDNDIAVLKQHTVFDGDYLKRKERYFEDNRLLGAKEEALRKEQESAENGYANNVSTLISEVTALQKKVSQFEQMKQALDIYRHQAFYNFTEGEFLYSKQVLYSRGLLVDSGIGGIGMRPFEEMAITEFGKGFIEYIKEEQTV